MKLNVFSWSQRHFAQVTWRVENSVVIGSVHFKPEHCIFWSNFEFNRNIVSGTGAWQAGSQHESAPASTYLLHGGGRDKMDAIQMTFPDAFSWMKIYKFRLRIHWSLFPKDNIPALVQVLAWPWPGDKPLSEPMMVSLLTHICVSRPQWVKWPTLVKNWFYDVASYNSYSDTSKTDVVAQHRFKILEIFVPNFTHERS